MKAESSTQKQSAGQHRSDLPGLTIYPLETAEDRKAFRTLNEEWIVRCFSLEPRDVETLNDPDTFILRKGGHIFMIRAGSEAVGCVALIPVQNGVYELSKMAVSPGLRGMGIGRRLLEHAIHQARVLGASSLILGSSTKLRSALTFTSR